MRVEDIMTKEVFYCGPGTDASAAAEIMWIRNCGALPVVEEGGRVVGMVTDRDLFIALGTQNRMPAELSVGEIMTREPSICSPDDDVRDAMTTMAQRRLHRLPVVGKDGALEGIVSLDDIALRADMERLSKDLLRTMKAVVERPTNRTAGA